MDEPPDPATMDRSIPHDKRWPLLKDIIISLFIGRDFKIADVAKHMKEVYGFDAQPAHYRYRFKSWNIHKRTTAPEKDKIIQRHIKRGRVNASTSDIALVKGGIEKPLSEKVKAQLRRYANEKSKKGAASLPAIVPGFILQWNFPYHALLSTGSGPFDHTSPSASTPPFFTVNSPPAAAPSPGRPVDAPSPTALALRKIGSLDHVGMFLQGRSIELLKSLSPVEQKAASVWFHDLFLFSFMSAKYFGKGPTRWDAGLIAARSLGSQFAGASPSPRPAHALTGTPKSATSFDDPKPPTMLCRWSIHYKPGVDEDEIDWSPDPTAAADSHAQDLDDESTWRLWTGESQSLPDVIQEGITSGSFTQATTSLPVSPAIVSEALSKSPSQLRVEAIALGIICGNLESCHDLLEYRNRESRKLLAEIHPFHLAATNLRGAKGCCGIMRDLTMMLQDDLSVGMLYRNGNGHTILDTLMVTILRSHTSARPALVCSSFDRPERFPGEGIDICGRFDLDSPCTRRLFASGQIAVPMSWKHVFCHTSAQAICHTIIAIFSAPWGPKINTPSGIFIRTCSHCHDQLVPTPLHTLVVVAYLLATQGSPGETLFGAIAVLSCMLALGADPLEESDLSHQLILSRSATRSTTEQCEHAPATPLRLAHALHRSSAGPWTPETRLGWDIFVKVLAEGEKARGPISSPMSTCCHFDDFPRLIDNHFCGSSQLGQLWAAVQAELVTYRRLDEDQPWLSPHFDLQLLQTDSTAALDASGLPLIAKGMLKECTPCGWVVSKWATNYNLPRTLAFLTPSAQDICSYYFMNMDSWKRTDFCEPWDPDTFRIEREKGSESSNSEQSSHDEDMSDEGGQNEEMVDGDDAAPHDGQDENMMDVDEALPPSDGQESNGYHFGHQGGGGDVMWGSGGFSPSGGWYS
ncbi:hypothetical protein RB600_005179 [Gaeumannomyces tritici]